MYEQSRECSQRGLSESILPLFPSQIEYARVSAWTSRSPRSDLQSISMPFLMSIRIPTIGEVSFAVIIECKSGMIPTSSADEVCHVRTSP